MANFMDKLKAPLNIGHQEPTEIERVQQKFTQLGSMFYRDNMNNDNLEESYKEVIELVKKLDENRKSFYAHKLRLEGNMMCMNCGEIIPYGSVYCSKCGKRANEKETP